MSPEQITDSRSVDKRADIYSMGVMLYEMLTGTKPFPSNLNEETLEKIKKGRYVNPRKIDKSIPPVICRMINKMLKANPDRRFQSIDKVIRIVKKYLSHYDTHAIRIALAQTVLSKRQFAIPTFEKKTQHGKKITIRALIALCLGLAVWFVWQKGYIHKTILRHWYSPVVLTMDMRVTVSADSDLPVRAFFFVDDGKEIPEVKGSRRVFFAKKTSDKNVKNETVKNYETTPVYLRHGKYRIKIAAGPYVIWRSVVVDFDSVNIKMNGLKNARRNVILHTESYDSESGKSLSEMTKFFVSIRGKWVLVEDVNLNDLKTGSVLKVFARCEGYKDAYYSLILDWYQDELILSAALEKKLEE